MDEPRTIVFGDVHGCLAELRGLVARVSPKACDTLVFCGDLVDKGPHSAAVVRFVRELAERVPVVLVKGNHEERHERFRRHEARAAATGKKNPMERTAEVRAITAALSPADVAFLEAAVLFHAMPAHGALVVHGGVPASMEVLPGALEGVSRAVKEKAHRLLRMRFVDEAGKMVKMGEVNRDRHVFWADSYDGRFGHVYFGHEPFMAEVGRFAHATGIDTGCVFGGSLTAVVLVSGHEPRFVSEDAAEEYKAPLGPNA